MLGKWSVAGQHDRLFFFMFGIESIISLGNTPPRPFLTRGDNLFCQVNVVSCFYYFFLEEVKDDLILCTWLDYLNLLLQPVRLDLGQVQSYSFPAYSDWSLFYSNWTMPRRVC